MSPPPLDFTNTSFSSPSIMRCFFLGLSPSDCLCYSAVNEFKQRVLLAALAEKSNFKNVYSLNVSGNLCLSAHIMHIFYPQAFALVAAHFFPSRARSFDRLRKMLAHELCTTVSVIAYTDAFVFTKFSVAMYTRFSLESSTSATNKIAINIFPTNPQFLLLLAPLTLSKNYFFFVRPSNAARYNIFCFLKNTSFCNTCTVMNCFI